MEWIGREGLDTETHEEYLNNFIAHFYKNIIKLVDRAMRKEDSSAQGQIVTEILQHLHACNNSVKVFYGREESLERIKNYMMNYSEKPLVFYGEVCGVHVIDACFIEITSSLTINVKSIMYMQGGCGKTSLLAKSASLALTDWFKDCKPINIVRFLGTTPDSSALTPTLISICQQVRSYQRELLSIPD